MLFRDMRREARRAAYVRQLEDEAEQAERDAETARQNGDTEQAERLNLFAAVNRLAAKQN